MVPYGMLFFSIAIGGLIGEIICNSIGKKSNIAKMVGIAFPMLGLAIGEYIPLLFMQEAFKAQYADSFTGPTGFVAMELVNMPVAIILTVVTFICAILGYLWGTKIVAKRFANQGGKINEGNEE